MKRIAIVTASQYGQTAKIASVLQSEFVSAGIPAELIPPTDGLGDYDGVVIGAPVYIGKFSPEVVDWAKRNLDHLNKIQTAFFSVSLNAADKRPEARKADDQLLRSFLEQTGLDADFVASVAGMLHYTKYGWFKRWLLKRISKSAGGPTDMSKDHEMTDWDQVRAFAAAFVEMDRNSQFATARRLPSEPSPDVSRLTVA